MTNRNFDNKILFSCGDRSADIYLSFLIKNLQQLSSDNLKTIVLAGDKSQNLCSEFVENIVSYDAHGFFSPFKLILKFINVLKKVNEILKKGVDAVVLMDYYGFNIKIAKLAKKYNIKVIYYILPQVWATRKYRIKKIKKYVDYAIVIFPFEKELFMKEGIKTDYFGHPMLDLISVKDFDLENNKEKNEKIIGLFPGSRKQVIKWNLPVMLKIVKFYLNNYSKEQKFYIFGFEKYKELYKKLIYRFLGFNLSENVRIVYNNELRDKIYLSLAVSGTNLLENVFYNIPTIVIYKLPLLMYIFIKKIIYINTISLPNIILKEKVIPEFIQNRIDIEKLSLEIYNFVSDENRRNVIINKYNEIKVLLSKENNVSLKVAEKILEFVYGET
ncbi:MAG: lipid-A-disaccharide synthase [Endomicrobiia bacterium]